MNKQLLWQLNDDLVNLNLEANALVTVSIGYAGARKPSTEHLSAVLTQVQGKLNETQRLLKETSQVITQCDLGDGV
ncbi:hypothetical protein [Alteromonas oceanisediminis]|uniref:hypothetical protein n=1 Tax=Alteromonas oceanisediminis TaxID=2836180 RepID=UPI001BD91833|nr:hypothetical protein [Alteromonas oceanisediminis]MBT0585114.1 hypothetical protein [Alteromonas oceanisediminis]